MKNVFGLKLKTQSNKTNWEYHNNTSNTSRYVLGERGTHILGCIGINPSTAKPFELDNTMKSVKRIAQYNGFDGWMMYNIYALRATNPKDLPIAGRKTLHQKNIIEIKNSVQKLGIETIWLAYGDLIESRSYLQEYLFDIYAQLKPLQLNWKIVNQVTKKGHPRHPLYQAAKSKLQQFDFAKQVSVNQ